MQQSLGINRRRTVSDSSCPGLTQTSYKGAEDGNRPRNKKANAASASPVTQVATAAIQQTESSFPSSSVANRRYSPCCEWMFAATLVSSVLIITGIILNYMLDPTEGA